MINLRTLYPSGSSLLGGSARATALDSPSSGRCVKPADLFLLAMLPLLLAGFIFLTPITVYICPVTVDSSLRKIDLLFGLDGLALTRWVVRHGLYPFAPPIYSALPLMMLLGYALERSKTLIRAMALGAIFAFPFYLLIPAVGPAWAFQNFPGVGLSIMDLAHPRNCFPSMHFTWALLIALNLRNPRWRWLFILYAALMAVVPVIGGEHYFVDMIAAIPFTCAVQWISVWLDNRQRVQSLERQAQYLLAHGGQAECQRDIAARCQELLRLRFAMGNRE